MTIFPIARFQYNFNPSRSTLNEMKYRGFNRCYINHFTLKYSTPNNLSSIKGILSSKNKQKSKKILKIINNVHCLNCIVIKSISRFTFSQFLLFMLKYLLFPFFFEVECLILFHCKVFHRKKQKNKLSG